MAASATSISMLLDHVTELAGGREALHSTDYGRVYLNWMFKNVILTEKRPGHPSCFSLTAPF